MTDFDKRVAMEKKIVREIGRRAFAAGYTLNVVTEGHQPDNDDPITTLKDLWDHASACDESLIEVMKPRLERVGTVFLVFGNDGDDVVCDHTDIPEISALIPEGEKYEISY